MGVSSESESDSDSEPPSYSGSESFSKREVGTGFSRENAEARGFGMAEGAGVVVPDRMLIAVPAGVLITNTDSEFAGRTCDRKFLGAG